MVGATICSLALYLQSFWLFCFGTMVFGVYNAAAQYYRFAAADVASADFRAKAISLVLAGAWWEASSARRRASSRSTCSKRNYLGAYLSLIWFLVLVVLVVQLLDIPVPAAAARKEPTRPLAQIMAQPVFVSHVRGGDRLRSDEPPHDRDSACHGICGHPYSAAATVIGWHVIGMFGRRSSPARSSSASECCR